MKIYTYFRKVPKIDAFLVFERVEKEDQKKLNN